MRIWLASSDGVEPPRLLTPEASADEQRPFFGASGAIYFMTLQTTGTWNLSRVASEHSPREMLYEDVHFLVNVSPDEKWAVIWALDTGASLLPLGGGPLRRLCKCGMGPILPDSPKVSWSGDGKTMLVSGEAPDKGALLIPWLGGEMLSTDGVPSWNDLQRLARSKVIVESSVAPGRTSDTYAFTRTKNQSNLYRIRVRQ